MWTFLCCHACNPFRQFRGHGGNEDNRMRLSAGINLRAQETQKIFHSKRIVNLLDYFYKKIPIIADI